MAQNFNTPTNNTPTSNAKCAQLPRLNTQTYGTDGMHLAFIHGWGLNSGVWESIASKLEGEFRITLIDLPGFGLNQNQLPNEYSLETITEMVAQTIDEPSVVLGWSLGGLVVTQLALDYPEKVQALIKVTSSPCFIQKDGWHGIEANLLKNFHLMLSKSAEETISTFLKIQAMGSPHLRQDIKKMQTLVMSKPQPARETLDASLMLLEQVDLRAQLSQIKQPCLSIYGRLDSLVPKAAIEPIANLAPQSQQIVMEKASHAPFISHEKEFIDHLTHWLLSIK